jgi:hypothetical protein
MSGEKLLAIRRSAPERTLTPDRPTGPRQTSRKHTKVLSSFERPVRVFVKVRQSRRSVSGSLVASWLNTGACGR